MTDVLIKLDKKKHQKGMCIIVKKEIMALLNDTYKVNRSVGADVNEFTVTVHEATPREKEGIEKHLIKKFGADNGYFIEYETATEKPKLVRVTPDERNFDNKKFDFKKSK